MPAISASCFLLRGLVADEGVVGHLAVVGEAELDRRAGGHLHCVGVEGDVGHRDGDGSAVGHGGGRRRRIGAAGGQSQPQQCDRDDGETVEFRFTNDGKVPHDAFVGDEATQQEHEAEMAGMPAGHEHDMGTEGVTVQPGETEVLTYTFEQPGEVQIGCHQKGHYAAGMHLSVLVG